MLLSPPLHLLTCPLIFPPDAAFQPRWSLRSATCLHSYYWCSVSFHSVGLRPLSGELIPDAASLLLILPACVSTISTFTLWPIVIAGDGWLKLNQSATQKLLAKNGVEGHLLILEQHRNMFHWTVNSARQGPLEAGHISTCLMEDYNYEIQYINCCKL